jgi:hypothetical protein
MQENAVEDREIGPTYKSLFLGACGLISLAFGWWFTGFISAYDTLTARVAALEVRDTETKWTFRINAEKLNTHEDRLRALEREPDQRKRVGTE